MGAPATASTVFRPAATAVGTGRFGTANTLAGPEHGKDIAGNIYEQNS